MFIVVHFSSILYVPNVMSIMVFVTLIDIERERERERKGMEEENKEKGVNW